MKYKEMKQELNDINNKVKIVNPEYISKLTEYINCTDRIKDISELLQEAETIRKKYNKDETKEKVNVVDADGRKKIILKDNELEYNKLVEEKKHLMNIQKKLYNELMKLQSKKDLFETKSEEPEMSNITESSNKENVESNVNNEQLITNKEKEISKKEVFLKTLEGFSNDSLFTSKEVKNESTELSEKEKFLKAIDEFYSDPLFAPIETEKKESNETKSNVTLSDLNNYIEAKGISLRERKDIELKPFVKANFRDRKKVNLSKSYVSTEKKGKIKKLASYILNGDKYIKLGFAKLNGKVLDGIFFINKYYINFKKGSKQAYNSTISFVKKVPKKTAKLFKDIWKSLKGFVHDKKKIIETKKEDGLLSSMEKVYGDKKNKHLDYLIVNRYAKFKENSCQKSGKTSIIASVTKNVCDNLAKPFNYLRENARDNVKRSELQEQINIIRQKNLEKKRTLKSTNTSNNGGYVISASLITVSIAILSVLIFTIIGKLLN